MKTCGHTLVWRGRLAGVVWACTGLKVLALSGPPAYTPQLLDLQLSDAHLVLEVEQRHQRDTLPTTSESSTYKAQSIAPSADLTINGSIYHPNLLELSLMGQFGYDWEKIAGTGLTNAKASSFLQNYDARVGILREKPYAATLSAGRSEYVREYDFFTTVRGEAQRYGGSAGYTEGPIPFTVEASRAETSTEGEPAPAFSRYDTIHLDARNVRSEKNHTELTYGYTQFRREYTGQNMDEGMDHTLQLNDAEVFGTVLPPSLTSSFTYHHGDDLMSIISDTLPLDQSSRTHLTADSANLQEHLELPHTASFRTAYDYTFDYFRQGDFNSANHRGQASLIHQLYESLTSCADVHGGVGQSAGGTTAWENNYYGVGLNEAYTKKLGAWARLNLSAQGTLDHQNNQSSGDTTPIPVFQERHVLSDGAVTFLNLLQADPASIRITDAGGIIAYREFFDYEVIVHGAQTEIRRVSGGTIPNGSTVLVDYRAANPSSSSGDVMTDSFFIRLDLFQGLVGFYARLTQTKSYGGDNWLSAQNSDDRLAGVEVIGRNGNLQAEYEVYDSDQTTYNATRLSQSLTFPVGLFSHAGLTASEMWTYFPEAGQHRNTYQLIARYNVQLTSMLDFSIEGGKRLERGDLEEDRDLTTLRVEVNCQVGDVSIRATYETEGEVTPDENRDTNRFYLRIKRSF